MPAPADLFLFRDSPPPVDANSLVVPIPAGINGVWDLLHLLAAELQFPGYFGGNFDALVECLRDLAWLPPGQSVQLVHADLPLLYGSHAREAYLSVLTGVIQHWRTVGDRRFEVAFPALLSSGSLFKSPSLG